MILKIKKEKLDCIVNWCCNLNKNKFYYFPESLICLREEYSMVNENVVYQGDFSITDINGDVDVKKKRMSQRVVMWILLNISCLKKSS